MKVLKNQFVNNWQTKSKKTNYDTKPMTWKTVIPASYEDESGERVLINLVTYGETKKESEQNMFWQCLSFGKGELSVLAEER